MITDSGDRTEFESGAVRDIKTENGRCDLLPMSVIGNALETCNAWERAKPNVSMDGMIFQYIETYQATGNSDILYEAIACFLYHRLNENYYHFMLELSKHFKEGAEKYGEYNWQKGIPTKSYIDSAVRHYLKYKAGWTDESHDRAFVWNLVCCIWTCTNKSEFNTYAPKVEEVSE